MKADTERRARNPHRNVAFPLVCAPSGGKDHNAQTRDVSANGIFLYTNSKMEKGTEVELVLILPRTDLGEKCWVCCQATIVRVEKKRDRITGLRPRSAAWTSFPKSRCELRFLGSLARSPLRREIIIRKCTGQLGLADSD